MFQQLTPTVSRHAYRTTALLAVKKTKLAFHRVCGAASRLFSVHMLLLVGCPELGHVVGYRSLCQLHNFLSVRKQADGSWSLGDWLGLLVGPPRCE